MITTPEDQAVCPTCGQVYPSRVGHCVNDGTHLIVRLGRGADASGRVLDGRYDVRAAIGEGKLGVVYLGWQRILDREVAIKVLRPGLTRDPEGLDRFSQAARLACQLVAPAVTATYDCSNDGGVIYIVMELIRGRSLSDVIVEGPVPAYRVVPIAIQICDALAAAAKLQLFHGDLKPGNVLADLARGARGESVKVSDFGLLRALVPNVTTGIEPSGLYYAAPELVAGGTVTARTDLYALGCVLYELLAGRPPFVDGSIRALIDKHEREMPPKLPRDVPARVATIISTLLAKKPADRFASAAAAREALHAAQGTTGRSTPMFAGDSGPTRSGPSTGAHTRPPITGSQHRPVTGNHPSSGVPNAMTGAHSLSGPHATTPPSGPHATTPPSGQHPTTGPRPALYPNATRPQARAASSRRTIIVIMCVLVAIGIAIGVQLATS